MRCAKAWTEWELSMFGLIPDPAFVESHLADEEKILTKALLEWYTSMKTVSPFMHSLSYSYVAIRHS